MKLSKVMYICLTAKATNTYVVHRSYNGLRKSKGCLQVTRPNIHMLYSSAVSVLARRYIKILGDFQGTVAMKADDEVNGF